jgi:hypothetical protein
MYVSINNNGYFQGIYASHSQILHLFQFAVVCVCGSGGWEGREVQILYKKKSPNIAFHFFTTIKLIYTLVYQSLNSIFFLCFLKYESFSNCQQSYNRNIGYFEGISVSLVNITPTELFMHL